MVNQNTISFIYVLMSCVLNCLMEETILLNDLLMKDNQLNETSLPDPGASQNMTIKCLSFGQISRFIYQQIALHVLFQMRYNSPPTPTNSQMTVWELRQPLVFTSLQYCCFLLFCFLFWLSCSGVCQHPPSFWSVTQSLLGAYQAAIPLLKEDSNTSHTTPIASILHYK